MRFPTTFAVLLGICQICSGIKLTNQMYESNKQKSIEFKSLKLSNEQHSVSKRITNGTSASIKEFPFIVFLFSGDGGNGEVCGGTLISPSIVLTAAHCLYNNESKLADLSEFYVSAGSRNNIKKNDNIYRASKLISHPDYEYRTAANDIGIVMLSSEVPSNIATPAKIFGSPVNDDMPVVAAGWGLTSNDLPEHLSNTLNQVSVNVSSSNLCKISSPSWKGNAFHSICTIVVDGKDACKGDSGGPLVAEVEQKKLLVGITSFGNYKGYAGNSPCGLKDGAGFYTNVCYYIGWIIGQTGLKKSQLLYR